MKRIPVRKRRAGGGPPRDSAPQAAGSSTAPSRSAGPPDSGRDIPHIALLTCMWKRHALTRFVFDWYRHLAGEVAGAARLTLHAAGSEGAASRDLAQARGFHYVEAPNQPLGAKWNAALASVRPHEPDAVLLVGSDDLLNRTVIETYAGFLRHGARFVGLLDIYVLDLATRRLVYWPGYEGPREGETAGLGRLVHREILDRAGWRLWKEGLQKGLDRSMMETLTSVTGSAGTARSHFALRSSASGFAPVDVKTGQNIWSFEVLARAPGAVPADEDAVLRRRYPDPWLERLFGLDLRGET